MKQCISGFSAVLALVLFGLITNPLVARQADPTNAAPNLIEDTNLSAITITNDADQELFRKRFGLKASSKDAMVVVGHDAELKAGETVDAVVVIGGNARVHGTVLDSVVVVGGNALVDSEVGDAVVVVLGNVELRKGAKIKGDAIAVGGSLKVDDGATVQGEKQEVDFGAMGFHAEWLKNWLIHCVLKLRPLAPQVGFVWVIALCFFLLYVLMAVLFPGPVQACVDELTRRPATTFLMGLLTKFLLPLCLLILAITGVGLVVVPFVIVALLFGALLGKVALLEWLGFKLGRFAGPTFSRPLAALILGSLLLTILYMVPILGLGTMMLFGIWGLGAAVLAAFSRFRRERPPVAGPQSPLPAAAPAGPTPGMASAGPLQASAYVPGNPIPELGAAAPPVEPSPQSPIAPVMTTQLGLPDVLSHPRAGFWIRMGAGFLDMVIVGVIGGVLRLPPLGFLFALLYFAGMWSWKGSTVGGAIFGLRVVRLDGLPITFLVAIVRGLAAALSIFMMFLGFLWIAWDSEKQGWHDRIAGTVVLRLPRSMPLILV